MTDHIALTEDDLGEPGVFEATTLHSPLAIPRCAVLCFFNELLDRLALEGELEPIYTLRSEVGRNPVYQFQTDLGAVVVVHPGLGAPMAAGFTEEIAALGVTTFVACGGAGALVDHLALGHVMVVDSAVRDEGTSFHYVAPDRIIEAQPLGVAVLKSVLEEWELTPSSVGPGRPTQFFARRVLESTVASPKAVRWSTWSHLPSSQ